MTLEHWSTPDPLGHVASSPSDTGGLVTLKHYFTPDPLGYVASSPSDTGGLVTLKHEFTPDPLTLVASLPRSWEIRTQKLKFHLLRRKS